MMTREPLITTGTEARDSLAAEVAVVSGAGRGTGLEAARALAWLGSQVCIAEINRRIGEDAAERVAVEFGAGTATFVQTDVGNEWRVDRLARRVLRPQLKIGSPYRVSCR
jgi:NAD(P)-dependent dehydrogenase (short-subunit alcohol dehydrogenase family)